MGIREPRVERERGELDDEAEEESGEDRDLQAQGEVRQEPSRLVTQRAMQERGHVERIRVRAVHGGVHPGAVEVQGEDR